MPYTILKHCLSEEWNAKDVLETHFSHEGVCHTEDSTVQPLKRLHELFSSGLVKGDIMLESSAGGMVSPLFLASKYFKEIYVMEFTDGSVNHFKQWLENSDESTDWSYGAKLVCGLEGNEDGWKEKEEEARRAVKGVFKYDLLDSNSKKSVAIPEVDCVLTVYQFNIICQTKEDFKHNMKILTSRLKVGGYMVILYALNMTFYQAGDHKFSSLTVDKKFIKKVMTDTGFEIVKEEVIPTVIEHDLTDCKDVAYIVARKGE
ncbi:nicotinamide N-methyltransferase-like [Eleutherodactylus coqui]|uniref:nicotinamide N-methyltransferase-like n=1 Tax=Eleutherodactylus coqui TaxID=57060 RepID=UPI00346246D7